MRTSSEIVERRYAAAHEENPTQKSGNILSASRATRWATVNGGS
eukprot:CAMPEP_0180393180 /NCGR_PEP_ID=MMETSP0989-20121125/33608_1 /TAXON_ID=697907 /ORGANISM="non described non described, Strain CCMP2293" /LENGTH=43 /DNA_ID= /DNA_START= /DNA_END= /DNA_ORIENTATION=